MPSRSGVNSTRRSARLRRWRFSMLTGWWRSRQVRALARKRPGTRSPARQPRAGFGASGSRKCASRAAAPAGSRPAVSSTTIRACCQEIVPACSAASVSGRFVVSARESDTRAPAVRSLTVRTQATSATVAISWAVLSCGDAAGDANNLLASTYSAVSLTFRAAVPASCRANSARASRQSSASSRSGSASGGRPPSGTSAIPVSTPKYDASTAAEAATAAMASLLSALQAVLLSIPTASQEALTSFDAVAGIAGSSGRKGHYVSSGRE